MREISRLRFDSLAGYSRSPMMPLFAEEVGWFEEANEKVLGVLVRDIPDNDFGCYVLGRDAKGRYRTVWLECSLPTADESVALLARKLAEHAQMRPEEFYQGDEVGKPLDFFTPVRGVETLNPNCQSLIGQRGYSPALKLITEMMNYFEDADGNFVEQFQTTGFDARLWELYLYALFTELGYRFDRKYPAPDFHCIGPRGNFFIEATTVNPSAGDAKIDESTRQAYFEHYVPIKFGSALFSKLDRGTKPKYWELPHVVGHPFVLAIQDFHQPLSMSWSSSALVEYLYGIRQRERRKADGGIEVVSEPVKFYRWGEKEIPCCFFNQPNSENVSAVIANPSGTLSKFNRMGFVAGFGDRDIRMVRKGFCYRGSVTPQDFSDEVHLPGYSETWVEGLSVYHNPNAINHLHEDAIPGAAHCTSRDARIVCSMPGFHPMGSITAIVVPTRS
jgi:hypothetical protein